MTKGQNNTQKRERETEGQRAEEGDYLTVCPNEQKLHLRDVNVEGRNKKLPLS